MSQLDKRKRRIISDEINLLIDLAWDDRISFKDIEDRLGFSEADVKSIMKKSLKFRSYVVWRKRVKKYKKARR